MAERHDELTHWLATFDCTDDDAMRDTRTAGHLRGTEDNLSYQA